ncbi:MAG: hypothetical protein WCW52_05190 [Elusimicrobiales bacterium]|jgi:hypothetical protein
MKKIILIPAAWALCAACGNKVPPAETVPAPKAQAAAPAAPAAAGNLLTAPGDYLRTTAGQIDKAKAARALAEKTAKERLESPD